jgi:hypothetical protein
MNIRSQSRLTSGERWLLVIALACTGCSAKHPQAVEATPQQQQQWAEEEAAASQKQLEEARARGQAL